MVVPGVTMVDCVSYGRLRDLGGLPDMVVALSGPEGLARMFREQQLPLGLLDSPDTPVPMRDLVALYQRAAEICGIRSFGLEASIDVDVADHGLVARYVLQASTLGKALDNFRAALPFHESGSELRVECGGGEARVCYTNIYQDMIGWRHAGDFTLCIIVGVIRHYLGHDWAPIRVETCYPKGDWTQDHEDAFAAPLHHIPDEVAIVINREDLHRAKPNRRGLDCELVSLAEIRNNDLPLPRNLPQVVANVIDGRLAYGCVDLEGTASKLCLGVRTLQRQLEDHGLKYRDLVLNRRMQRAKELLAEQEFGIGQIGRMVGYSSPPQFTRAFRNHCEVSPLEFRNAIVSHKH